MCTLTYIPRPDHSFLLTSNRDESVTRMPALPPRQYKHNGVSVVYPKDTQAGGTWLAIAGNGFTLCLLNGAFVRHQHRPPYRHSRGLVITGFFAYNNVPDFLKLYDFKDLEPFTLVIFESGNEPQVHEIRWDGKATSYSSKNAYTPHIWSSASLYDTEVIQEREKWFHRFLNGTPAPELADMLRFHHFGGGQETPNSLLMNRNNILKTISITGIHHHLSKAFIHHENLLTNELSDTDFLLQPDV